MSASNFTFRMPDELREKLEQDAKRDSRSLSNLIIKVLNDYVENKSEDKEKR
ncbi:MAG: Arc family DNA-binding protein [Lachnospiraceae bacterium]|jgi:predicted HicB family RNase H-like nuclease|nr:Arc family DNA-binding protein [Lachnospiraceae bacterium]